MVSGGWGPQILFWEYTQKNGCTLCCLSKKQWAILYSNLLHKMADYFLDTQYVKCVLYIMFNFLNIFFTYTICPKSLDPIIYSKLVRGGAQGVGCRWGESRPLTPPFPRSATLPPRTQQKHKYSKTFSTSTFKKLKLFTYVLYYSCVRVSLLTLPLFL